MNIFQISEMIGAISYKRKQTIQAIIVGEYKLFLQLLKVKMPGGGIQNSSLQK